MSRKKELALVFPQEPAPPVTAIVPVKDDGTLAKREAQVRNEAYIEQLVADFQRVQGLLGHYYVKQLHESFVATFTDTVDTIWECTRPNGYREKEHQGYLDQFREQHIPMMTKHLIDVTNVSVANILAEVQRTMYVMPVEERKSFLRRLFGG